MRPPSIEALAVTGAGLVTAAVVGGLVMNNQARLIGEPHAVSDVILCETGLDQAQTAIPTEQSRIIKSDCASYMSSFITPNLKTSKLEFAPPSAQTFLETRQTEAQNSDALGNAERGAGDITIAALAGLAVARRVRRLFRSHKPGTRGNKSVPEPRQDFAMAER